MQKNFMYVMLEQWARKDLVKGMLNYCKRLMFQ